MSGFHLSVESTQAIVDFYCDLILALASRQSIGMLDISIF